MTGRGCSVEGCPEPHDARGYCAKHYKHWRRHGDATAPLLRVRGRGCKIDACPRPHEAKGYCKLHYQRDTAGVPRSAAPQLVLQPQQSRKEYLDALWAEIQEKRRLADAS